MIGEALLVLQAAAVQPSAPEASPGPFGVAALSEEVLARQRGGIRLPGGIDVSLSVDTVTAIDGRVVLQTITRIAETAPTVTAYAPVGGGGIASPAMAQTTQGTAPGVSYDPRNGMTVTATIPAVSLIMSKDSRNGAPAAIPGLQAVDLANSAATPNGVVRQVGEGGGSGGVELQGLDFSVMHLTGSAMGATILNSGSDRAIETSTTLYMDLSNAGPDLIGSSMLRVEDIGLLAVGSRF
ncbi:hypothetical protein [Croceicoccus marinus]|uniref:Uncharacterized protein n=1 Tax=Croceicoccus marinus TaxID=450378 RepID=A0A1Z1FGP8_9SPHN|nr:hypothetical protein [Croceicoccus marinus]ARU17906.1 hypothetical protein A9D14_16425 [Croceicoccus marinus]QNE07411.1 hypothetical protein H4O24_16135 [Croceicoccus marinus]